jgi:hypothetical protein
MTCTDVVQSVLAVIASTPPDNWPVFDQLTGWAT